MLKRGVVVFLVVFLFVVKISYAGSCDLSLWKVYDDTGAVTFGGATIGGFMFSFTSETVSYGFRRLFVRNDFGSVSTTNTTSDQIKNIADSFMASNSQKFGIFSYSNSRIYGTSSSGVDVAYDTIIIVDPNTCEGLEYVTGDAILYYDIYGNLLGAEFRVVLTFLGGSSSSSLPPTNFSNPNYGGVGGAAGGGAGGGGGGAGAGAGGSKGQTGGDIEDRGSNPGDVQNPGAGNNFDIEAKKYLGYAVPIMPVFLFLFFTSILFFLLGSRRKKKY